MTQPRLTFAVWRGLRSACSSALAGDAGGDFTEEDLDRIEKADEWLVHIGRERRYYERFVKVDTTPST